MRQSEASQLLAQQRFNDDHKLVEIGKIPASRLAIRQSNLDSAIAEAEIGAITAEGTVAKLAEATADWIKRLGTSNKPPSARLPMAM